MSAAPGAQGHACAVGPPASPVRSVLRHVQLENLAAGLSGGVVSTLVLHPLDLVKIRFAGEAGPGSVISGGYDMLCCCRRSVQPDRSSPGFSLSLPQGCRRSRVVCLWRAACPRFALRHRAQQLRCSRG